MPSSAVVASPSAVVRFGFDSNNAVIVVKRSAGQKEEEGEEEKQQDYLITTSLSEKEVRNAQDFCRIRTVTF